MDQPTINWIKSKNENKRFIFTTLEIFQLFFNNINTENGIKKKICNY